MICENCQEFIENVYGSGRFCSSKCARSFSTKGKREEINQVVSKKLKGRPSPFKGVPSSFTGPRGRGGGRKSGFTQSEETKNRISQSLKGSKPSDETRKKLKDAAIKRVKEGRHSGWKSRKGKKPSYAEQYFIDYFDSINLIYEREMPFGKYFIDFAFVNEKVALEVDGKQHKDREESDRAKDDLIQSLGWRVIRIKWVNPKHEANRVILHENITKFLKIIGQP